MNGLIWEDEGQASIEYIILVGGVILAAVIVAAVYSDAVKNAGETTLRLVEDISQKTRDMVFDILGID